MKVRGSSNDDDENADDEDCDGDNDFEDEDKTIYSYHYPNSLHAVAANQLSEFNADETHAIRLCR